MQNKLNVLVRCKDEQYVTEFCQYYINQGVDKIYIIDDNSKDREIYKDVVSIPQVMVYYDLCKIPAHNGQCPEGCTCNRMIASYIYNKYIKGKCEWLIYVDMDEFICTTKNSNMTIREQLFSISNSRHDIDSIACQWVYMYSDGLVHNPKSILESCIYRHDYDNRITPPDIYATVKPAKRKFNQLYTFNSKAIFKPGEISMITDHGPLDKDIVTVTGHNLKPNIRRNRITTNKDIDNSYFVCYHYKYISEQYLRDKMSTSNWYKLNGYKFDNLNSIYKTAKHLDTNLKKKVNTGNER